MMTRMMASTWYEAQLDRKFEELKPNDYDLGCNGYPLNYRVKDQQSRCSISNFMPIYIHKSSNSFNSWIENFKTEGNVVESIEEACISIYLSESGLVDLSEFSPNLVVLNFGLNQPTFKATASNYIAVQSNNHRRHIDFAAYLNVSDFDDDLWKEPPPLLPYTRKNFVLYYIDIDGEDSLTSTDISTLLTSSKRSQDTIEILRCSGENSKCSNDIVRDQIDWRLASIKVPRARFPEIHFILRSYSMSDVLEMRRQGRIFVETYLGDKRAITRSMLASLRYRLLLPSEDKNFERVRAKPLFNNSFTSPQSVIPAPPIYEEEYLGPLESSYDSPSHLHNFSSMNIYSHKLWNEFPMSAFGSSLEFLPIAYQPPTEVEFYPDSLEGFRPIEPGSGVEFSRALGGNLQREQFTVVLLTYNRDAVLSASLERLNRMPYLNKVIVIWNNIDREPPLSWPKLHVPVEFLKMTKNSLNNRFVPWDRIKTEAVFSLDDDIDLRQHEIILAFRIWRENRDRIVGFPARFHSRYNDLMYYNSNHTCQMSMILTGAAFIHKAYLYAYTFSMPSAIRKHVDEVTNCEDIAMNFLVSHLTRKPPIKTTSRWTLKCPTCIENLWQDESHFAERHECIRFFTKIYGYNPLRFTQFRADSILFKTRLPADKQKCFRFV
ncbi:hypothetical protein WR25_18979 [Diploscapter pachys]|uniref:Glycosyl transferase 64 domain-containing protein n=1 Tax=Diploscapter pachys TaxID=2018661 RepID=A0A2A2M082_9BILA|nr:hypothetical protein WR25_18979 [Diploscapter pachys]